MSDHSKWNCSYKDNYQSFSVNLDEMFTFQSHINLNVYSMHVPFEMMFNISNMDKTWMKFLNRDEMIYVIRMTHLFIIQNVHYTLHTLGGIAHCCRFKIDFGGLFFD